MPIPNYWNGCSAGCYPAYGPNAITTPPEYDESASIVQQIAFLFGIIEEVKETEKWIKDNAVTMPQLNTQLEALEKRATYALDNAVTLLEKQISDAENSLNASIEQTRTDFSADQQEQTQAITDAYSRDIHNLDLTLRALIQKIMDEMAAWDVTQGKANPTKSVMRALFDWTSPHAYDNDQATEFAVTWDDVIAAKLTARGLATWSAMAIPREGWQPKGVFIIEEGN